MKPQTLFPSFKDVNMIMVVTSFPMTMFQKSAHAVKSNPFNINFTIVISKKPYSHPSDPVSQ